MPKAVRASLDAENIEYKTVSFAGTGAKDVTEYLMNGHTAEDLVQLIDSDWVAACLAESLPMLKHTLQDLTQ